MSFFFLQPDLHCFGKVTTKPRNLKLVFYFFYFSKQASTKQRNITKSKTLNGTFLLLKCIYSKQFHLVQAECVVVLSRKRNFHPSFLAPQVFIQVFSVFSSAHLPITSDQLSCPFCRNASPRHDVFTTVPYGENRLFSVMKSYLFIYFLYCSFLVDMFDNEESFTWQAKS